MDELKPPFEVEFPDPGNEMSEDGDKRYDLGQINATEARGDVGTSRGSVQDAEGAQLQDVKPSAPGIDRTGMNLRELEKADRDAPTHNPTKQDHLYGPN
jgi:hypothetical protein